MTKQIQEWDGKGWRIFRNGEDHGEPVFESDDPQAIVDRADALELAAKDELPHIGIVGGSYRIEGDPFKLGVAWETDARGKVLRGPGPDKARLPTRLKRKG